MSDPATYGSTNCVGQPPQASNDGHHIGLMPPHKSPLEAVAPYFAEFVGTFVIVFTAATCSIVGNPTWNATAIAGIWAACVYVFGPVSGGHFNPAISFATGAAGVVPWKKVLMYICLQLCAGLCAGTLYTSVLGKSTTVGPVAPFDKTFYPEIVEMAFTAFLCFVFLNVVSSRQNNPDDDQNHFFGLAIGFVVVAGGYAGGNISGGCFNPAVALGLDPTEPWPFPSSSWWPYAYAGAELLGGLLAAVLFLLVRPEERFRQRDPSPTVEVFLLSRLLSEFLGTFMIVLTVGLCVVMKSVATYWAYAASLMCATYALGDVSGAHFNPAVTVAVTLSRRGKCPVLRGLLIIVVQLWAGFLAGLVVADVHNKGPNPSESFCLGPLSRTSASGNTVDYWQPVFWVEFTFTALLAYTVLAVATTTALSSYTRQNFQFGLAIGACVTAGGLASVKISGGVLNPAVAAGLQTSCKMSAIGQSGLPPLAYLANFAFFEVAGGICATVFFALTHSHEHSNSQETKLIIHRSQ